MKIILAVIGLFFCSCDAALFFSDNMHLVDLGNKENVLRWVSENVKYDYPRYESDNKEWQMPEYTKRVQTGVCRDMALLVLSAMTNNGTPCTLVWIQKTESTGKRLSHAVNRIDGKLHDARSNKFVDYLADGWYIVGEYNMQQALEMISFYGSIDK